MKRKNIILVGIVAVVIAIGIVAGTIITLPTMLEREVKPILKLLEKFPVTSIVIYQSSAISYNLVMLAREGKVNCSGIYSANLSGVVQKDTIKIDVENGEVLQWWLENDTLLFKISCNETANVTITYFVSSAAWNGRYNLELDKNKFSLVGFIINNLNVSFENITLILVVGKTHAHSYPTILKDVRVIAQTISLVNKGWSACSLTPYEGNAWRNLSVNPFSGSVDMGIYAIYWVNNITLIENKETFIHVWGTEVNITEYVKIESFKKPRLYLKVKNTSPYSFVAGNVYIYKFGIFAGSDIISYTPRNCSFELEVGYAFDIIVEREEVVIEQNETGRNISVRINITNKDISPFDTLVEETVRDKLTDLGNFDQMDSILTARFTLDSGASKLLWYCVWRANN